MSVNWNFSDRTILVTGASSGIGKSCAELLAGAGARVVAVGRRTEALADVRGVAEADRIALELTNEASVKTLVKALSDAGCKLAGCVLAAGAHTFRPLMLESFDELARPWKVNVQSCLGLLAGLIKSRMFERSASVVLFSSAAARIGSPGAVAYAASKGAIEAATATLAIELAYLGVRVNAVAPGVVKTPMSEVFLAKLSAEQMERIAARHPMGLGSPEDVAGPVAFLLSDEARWINGVVLAVDGGYSIA